jgi:hypothetical protein
VSRKLQFAIGFASLAALAAGLLAARVAHRRLQPTLEVSFWYWHSPFHMTKPERAQLDAMGVKSLFVRAGTFMRGASPFVWLFRRCGNRAPKSWEYTSSSTLVRTCCENSAKRTIACSHGSLLRNSTAG